MHKYILWFGCGDDDINKRLKDVSYLSGNPALTTLNCAKYMYMYTKKIEGEWAGVGMDMNTRENVRPWGTWTKVLVSYRKKSPFTHLSVIFYNYQGLVSNFVIVCLKTASHLPPFPITQAPQSGLNRSSLLSVSSCMRPGL